MNLPPNPKPRPVASATAWLRENDPNWVKDQIDKVNQETADELYAEDHPDEIERMRRAVFARRRM